MLPLVLDVVRLHVPRGGILFAPQLESSEFPAARHEAMALELAPWQTLSWAAMSWWARETAPLPLTG